MKPQVLLLYIDSSAKLGILPYLSSIFSSHLDFYSIQIDQLNPEVLTKYQLVLFSSALCESRVNEIIKEKGICSKQCVRELNYTHIHKILEIPSLSKVCIVSDKKKNCETVLKSLQDLGFTQYIYTIYYPGGPLPDSSFHHAITPGESRFVPSTIRNVIDIGNRNVDIATLCFIINYFHLPETLLNYVTNNYAGYISNFMRHTDLRSEESMRYFTVRDKILDTMNLGICVVDACGSIEMANHTFCSSLQSSRGHVKKHILTDLLREQGNFITFNELLSGTPVSLSNENGDKFSIFLADSFEISNRSLRYLFLLDGLSSRHPVFAPLWNIKKSKKHTILDPSSSLSHRIFQNRRIFYIFRTLSSFSESSFPVLLLGEDGLFQKHLAQYIHANSVSDDIPFLTLDAGHPISSPINSYSDLEALISDGNPATLFIDHLERASMEFQLFLSSVLGKINTDFTSKDYHPVRFICSYSGDIKEQISSGLFLNELFFQLNTLSLRLNPIRELKEMIPIFYEYILNELTPGNFQGIESIFTNQLLEFLIDYDYPGNMKELVNLCLYFHHVFNGKKLTLAQLPSYIDCSPYKKAELSRSDKAILDIVKKHPHVGRNKILILLEEQGVSLTPHQVRTILAELSSKSYIQVMKTKQGCTITELGEFILECCKIDNL